MDCKFDKEIFVKKSYAWYLIYRFNPEEKVSKAMDHCFRNLLKSTIIYGTIRSTGWPASLTDSLREDLEQTLILAVVESLRLKKVPINQGIGGYAQYIVAILRNRIMKAWDLHKRGFNCLNFEDPDESNRVVDPIEVTPYSAYLEEEVYRRVFYYAFKLLRVQGKDLEQCKKLVPWILDNPDGSLRTVHLDKNVNMMFGAGFDRFKAVYYYCRVVVQWARRRVLEGEEPVFVL